MTSGRRLKIWIKEFDSKPVYNEKCLKAKIKFYNIYQETVLNLIVYQ